MESILQTRVLTDHHLAERTPTPPLETRTLRRRQWAPGPGHEGVSGGGRRDPTPEPESWHSGPATHSLDTQQVSAFFEVAVLSPVCSRSPCAGDKDTDGMLIRCTRDLRQEFDPRPQRPLRADVGGADNGSASSLCSSLIPRSSEGTQGHCMEGKGHLWRPLGPQVHPHSRNDHLPGFTDAEIKLR